MMPARPRPQVSFVLPSFAGGGAERVTINLLHLLDRQRFAASLVVLDGGGPLVDRVPADVPVTILGQPSMRRALPSLVRHLRRAKPALVFSTFSHVNLPLLAARPWLGAAKFVVREANMPSANLPRMPWAWGATKAMRFLYPRADRVLATSARMSAELREIGVPISRLRLLPNPVDEVALRAAGAQSQRLPGAGLRFVASGRLTKQKGFDRLLEAMAVLPDNSRCLILGDGPERNVLEAQALRLGIADRCMFAGFLPDPEPWLAGADAFLLPSRFEGMPNAALEALALGTQVIATPEAGGIGEVEGVTLASAGPDFVAAMAGCRIDLRDQPRPSRLPARFHRDAVAEAFHLLLHDLLGRN